MNALLVGYARCSTAHAVPRSRLHRTQRGLTSPKRREARKGRGQRGVDPSSPGARRAPSWPLSRVEAAARCSI
jgi:hypothetical protein